MVEHAADQPAGRPEGAESPWWSILLLGAVVALVVVGLFIEKSAASTQNWIKILGVIATLCIFSVLYRENPLFRFMEHIFIGLATGWSLTSIWFNFIEPRWLVPLLPPDLLPKSELHEAGGGQWWLFIALLFGLLLYTVYFPKLSWMNRFVMGVIMGWVAGNALQQFMGGLSPLIVAAFRPPVTRYPIENAVAGNDIVIGGWHLHPFWLIAAIVLLCVMAYFVFSVEHRKAIIRHPAAAGRVFLMITLGAIFGTTVMARFSLLIARFEYVISAVQDWVTRR